MLRKLREKLRRGSKKKADYAPLTGPPAESRKTDRGANAQPPVTVPVQREPPPEGTADGLTVRILNQRGKSVRYECGHDDHAYFEIDALGKVMIPKDGRAPRMFCRACTLAYLQSTERCSRCGRPIMPGDGVAFYSGGLNEKRTWSRPYVEIDEQRAYLGCLDMDCCPSGGFFGGHLTEKGVRLAFGGNCAAGQALATGKVIISNV